MQTTTTNGIRISVRTFYNKEHSDPVQKKFVHVYEVLIENLTDYPVQLMARHWRIFDAYGVKREIIGEGVIGKQPIIQPGDYHSYSSWCPVTTEIGRMDGRYQMADMNSDEKFYVSIPSFDLVFPFLLN
ncbi:Co2+/Mg2+ efflux protein ApaG [Membranicola marinus]|uniref:Co2+/Mg2+ efflux protein ApaG n=1 Tax=Membranihabitans marinus TaxID=1227546 RepID=A0A953HZC1_9BACT|nr:Co2+/Mg2+ efflux protein ApaG [Membranihabitans marinus]MBY5958472.1 Co2+/Mg2+ efflux protein ApaG [Membranihabitans marinus]